MDIPLYVSPAQLVQWSIVKDTLSTVLRAHVSSLTKAAFTRKASRTMDCFESLLMFDSGLGSEDFHINQMATSSL